MKETDSPGVIALPPFIYLSGIILAFIVDWFFPMPFMPEAYDLPAGLFLIAIAIGLIAFAAQAFDDAGTEIDVRKSATTVVSTGPYSFSRNPMYLGMTLFMLGAALWLNSLWILGALVIVLIVMHYGVIFREEVYLEKKFGKTYTEYKEAVRRWI